MNIEKRLFQIIGDEAGYIHTARSRNDQVITDFKIWIRSATKEINFTIDKVIKSTLKLAEKNVETIMPGFTHLKNAQAISFAHYLMAYVEMFNRDKKRFINNLESLDESPLGVAALAGTSFNIDRNYTSKKLGFKRPTSNSIDTVSDRDFVLDFLYSVSVCSMHISRIAEGKKENKFGVSEKDFLELVKYINKSKFVNLKCLSVHIGSQILDVKPYENMLKALDKIIKKTNHSFEYIDLGGGMGIDYRNNKKVLNLKKYSLSIKKFLKNNNSKIIFEPGRSIVGNIGILVSKVTYIKEGHKKNFIILDVAMNDLMRPALYNSIHRILPATKSRKISNKTYEFVGPICESTDKFLTIKNFQKLDEKDLIIICDVGAYGISLSSNYNVRPKSIEILIKNSKINVINKRQKLVDLI